MTPRRRLPRRVLLVEDHRDSREFMQALLESDGHHVDAAAGSARRAGRCSSSLRADYEVLVTDIGLADGSGWDLIAAVRERWPSIRIGVVTGWEPRRRRWRRRRFHPAQTGENIRIARAGRRGELTQPFDRWRHALARAQIVTR